MSVGSADVFVNVVGGVRVDEPGADLAVALAVASAVKGIAVGGDEAAQGSVPPLAAFGEIGLTGELRSVAHGARRREEAAKFGLSRVLGPPGDGGQEVRTLREALRAALRGGPARAAA